MVWSSHVWCSGHFLPQFAFCCLFYSTLMLSWVSKNRLLAIAKIQLHCFVVRILLLEPQFCTSSPPRPPILRSREGDAPRSANPPLQKKADHSAIRWAPPAGWEVSFQNTNCCAFYEIVFVSKIMALYLLSFVFEACLESKFVNRAFIMLKQISTTHFSEGRWIPEVGELCVKLRQTSFVIQRFNDFRILILK